MVTIRTETRVSFRTRKGKRGMIRYPVKEEVMITTTSCGLEFVIPVVKERKGV
jgi:hypothetical protein